MTPAEVPRCTASKTSGDPCRHYAIKGTDPARCRYHVGKSIERARADVATAQLAASVFGTKIVPVTNPFVALGELAGELMAAKDALRDRVNNLSTIRYEGVNGAEQLRAEVALYRDLLGLTSKLVTDMARLNIDERMARVDELQARQMLDAFEATLVELGMTAEVREHARRVMVAHLAH